MTAFRSQTDEQLAARHDPAPHYDPIAQMRQGLSDDLAADAYLAPRVEYIPSRDIPGHIDSAKNADGTWSQVELYEGAFEYVDAHPEFARPPVNRVLVMFREDRKVYSDNQPELIKGRLWSLDLAAYAATFTPEEIEHARAVLQRLAVLS